MNWKRRYARSWERLDMKYNWEIKRLADIVQLNPKESIAKGTIAKKVPMDKLHPFCRDIPEYIFEKFNGGTKFRNGDTIMARITPCLENGKTAKVDILNDGEIGFGSTEYIVFRAIDGISDADYLYYLICSPSVRNPAIKSMIGSSGRQRVQIDVIENLQIEVPPLEGQRKIGSLLKSLDDKIALNNRINDNLQQQAQALFKLWFIDFEPFGGILPVDWKKGTIDDLATDIICGKTPSTKVNEYYGEDIPFITIPDMHNNTYVVATERYLSTIGATSQEKKTLPQNSICVSCIGTAGLVALTATKSQTNQQINSIIPKKGVSPYYIYLLMKTLYDTINKLGQSGSTIVNLNKTQFSKINVLVPTLKSMSEFDKVLEPVFEMIMFNQLENIKLCSLREVLLPKLMSGEINISNIQL